MRDGHVIYTNKAEAKILGAASPEALIGLPTNFIPPEEADMVRARREILKKKEIADCRQNARTPERQNARIRLDGMRVYVESAAIPIDWDGELANLLVIRDITEKLEASKHPEDSQTRYRRLIDASPDAIRVHIDGKIVFANEAAASLFGADSPDDLLGLGGDVLSHGDDVSEMDKLRDALDQSETKGW